MKTKTLPIIAMLLAPVGAFASDVSIDWTGQIQVYEATLGSPYPQALSDYTVSGVIDLNTDALPAPDTSNPGAPSFTGSGFLTSAVQWQGGLFEGEPAGSQNGSNLLSVDFVSGDCTISDSSTYVDSLQEVHQTSFTLNFNGLQNLSALGGTADFVTLGSGATGYFADTTGGGQAGFVSLFGSDKISARVMPAPEIDPSSAFTGLTLLAGALAVYRGRRG